MIDGPPEPGAESRSFLYAKSTAGAPLRRLALPKSTDGVRQRTRAREVKEKEEASR